MTAQLIAPIALKDLRKQDWTWRGHRIRYTIEGTGQPLVLIHGFGASIGHWRKNIPVLAAAGYQVHALDLLGFGDSDKPALDYSLDLWVALLKDYWQEFIQQPAVFIGNSIGGLLALMMLAEAPEMAKGGVLLNCAGGLNHRPDELTAPLRLVMGTFTKLVSSDLLGPFIFNQVRQKFRIRGSLGRVGGRGWRCCGGVARCIAGCIATGRRLQRIWWRCSMAHPVIRGRRKCLRRSSPPHRDRDRRRYCLRSSSRCWCSGGKTTPGHRLRGRIFIDD